MLLFDEPVKIFGIQMYAVCILIGIILAIYFGIKEGKKLGIYSDFIYLGVLITVPLAIAGARIWYILFNLDQKWDFATIIGLNGGLQGLAVQGGIIVAIVTVWIYCRKKKIAFYKVMDIVAPGFLIGQICGRWGNFFNSELYGPVIKNVEVFQNILPKFITENMKIDGFYRHPTFLYESALNLVGLILMFIARRKVKKMQSGDLVGVYLVWYGIVRIFTESLRMNSGVDEPLMLGPVPVSIALSALFIICGVAFMVIKRYIGPKTYYQDIIRSFEEQRIDTVLFDLDGTLLDTRRLINESFTYTFSKFFPERVLTPEELDSFFGPTLHSTFSRYCDNEEQIQEMMEVYRKHNIENHTKEFIQPFSGCKDVLKLLKRRGYKLGIVSSKRKEIILLGLQLFDLERYFDVIIAAEDVTEPKPSPEGIKKAIDILKPDANVLYVGDNPSDIQAGINANVKTCDVMYSDKFEECEKLNPTYCIKDLTGLYKILVE